MHSNSKGGDIASYTISEFSVLSGDASGLSLIDEKVHIDMSQYAHLRETQTEQIVIAYHLMMGFGASIPQTAVFVITGHQNGPSLSAANAKSILYKTNDSMPRQKQVSIALSGINNCPASQPAFA